MERRAFFAGLLALAGVRKLPKPPTGMAVQPVEDIAACLTPTSYELGVSKRFADHYDPLVPELGRAWAYDCTILTEDGGFPDVSGC